MKLSITEHDAGHLLVRGFSCVYAFAFEEIPGFVKVGYTSNLYGCARAYKRCSPFDVTLVDALWTLARGKAIGLEYAIKKRLGQYTVANREEWFKVEVPDVLDAFEIEAVRNRALTTSTALAAAGEAPVRVMYRRPKFARADSGVLKPKRQRVRLVDTVPRAALGTYEEWERWKAENGYPRK